jgi:hypothetical protein
MSRDASGTSFLKHDWSEIRSYHGAGGATQPNQCPAGAKGRARRLSLSLAETTFAETTLIWARSIG